jgi:hypothetical protein
VNLTTLLMTGLGLTIGLLLGALLYALWQRRKAGVDLRSVGRWPLGPRGLVTTHEHEIWTWLRHTFHEHVVLVKIPVQRFTTPLDRETIKRGRKGKAQSEQLLKLLDGIYTTFTVSTTDGKVLGCVDVPGKRGLSQDDFEVKEALLADCGIAYTVVRGAQLPTSIAMRAAFLGESAVEQVTAIRRTRSGDSAFTAEVDAFTRNKMHAAKLAALKELNKDEQQRIQAALDRKAGVGNQSADARKIARQDRLAGEWDNSFSQPADTRPARLDLE